MRDYLLGSDLIGVASDITFSDDEGSTITASPPSTGTTLTQRSFADLGIKPVNVAASAQPDETDTGTTLTQTSFADLGIKPQQVTASHPSYGYAGLLTPLSNKPKPQPPGMGFPAWELALMIGGAALAATAIIALVAHHPAKMKG